MSENRCNLTVTVKGGKQPFTYKGGAIPQSFRDAMDRDPLTTKGQAGNNTVMQFAAAFEKQGISLANVKVELDLYWVEGDPAKPTWYSDKLITCTLADLTTRISAVEKITALQNSMPALNTTIRSTPPSGGTRQRAQAGTPDLGDMFAQLGLTEQAQGK